MAHGKEIARYFSGDQDKLDGIFKDLRPVVRNVNGSKGELSLQLRENYFNIYYQGNSVAEVRVPRRPGGTYVVQIHKKFLVEKPWDTISQPCVLESGLAGLEGFRCPRGKGAEWYERFEVQPGKLAWFFQKSHLERLGRNIRRVNNGEEITFEQIVMTDNPPREDFILIDRQVADHTSTKQMDLLALARKDASDPFHFLILELKLGRNKELEGKVAGQLNEYIERIRNNIDDYACCYEKNYAQKWDLGLFKLYAEKANMTDRINIDSRPESVEGIVVVGGYSQLADEAVDKLKKAHPDVKVLPMMRRLNPADAI